MAVVVREATESDLLRILAIYRDSGLDVERSLDLADAQRLFRKMSSYPSYGVYVAESDGEVVGTFALLIMDNLANGGVPSGVVEDVAVARAAQGQGIGRAMMRFALDECRRHGCYKMLLSSNIMRPEAHRFYEALGFEKHGYSFRVELDDAAETGQGSG
jgi:GNAT superfamily N-acetyltransferase